MKWMPAYARKAGRMPPGRNFGEPREPRQSWMRADPYITAPFPLWPKGHR